MGRIAGDAPHGCNSHRPITTSETRFCLSDVSVLWNWDRRPNFIPPAKSGRLEV